MRDKHDNVVVVCSIENFDPMGVHTGDSITVAPAMTLTDREYQRLRDIGIAIIREVGVDTGGCNIQFAVNPDDGRIIVIEMNPRVSRSSALASKATGFPIAKIAARLAVGYTLDEIPNDITEKTPASFEPTLDYVVVKVPALRLREVPLRRRHPHHHHEVGRRGHGDRPQLHRGAQKALRSLEKKGSQFAFVGDPAATRPSCWTTAAGPHRRPDQHRHAGHPRRAPPRRRSSTPRGSTRGSSTSSFLIKEIADELAAADEARPRSCSPTPSGTASPTPRSPGSAACARTSCARSGTRWASARSTRRSTPAPPSSPRRRRTSTPPTTRRARSRRARSPP